MLEKGTTMKNCRKRTVVNAVLPLPVDGTDDAAAQAHMEQVRRERRKRARAQAYWAGRTLAMRRSARAAA